MGRAKCFPLFYVFKVVLGNFLFLIEGSFYSLLNNHNYLLLYMLRDYGVSFHVDKFPRCLLTFVCLTCSMEYLANH